MGFLGVALAAGGFHVKAANQVLKSAGGNFNDDNLSVGNVRPVAFGLSQTGDLSNLAATDAAFLALEATAGRNQVPSPLSAVPSPANGGPAAWNQLGVSRVGTGDKVLSLADEANRNTVPDLTKVPTPATGGPTAWLQLNVSRVGTQDMDDAKFTFEAARNNANGTVAGDIRAPATVKIRDVTITGTGTAGGPPPAAPTWGATPVTAGNGSVTVGLVANAPTDILQVRYKLKTASAWVAANVAHRRTGSGNVVISGLTNEALYTFSAYTLLAPAESEWLDPRECAPTAGANGNYVQFFLDLVTALQGSTVLASACTDGLPANHVKPGRYLHTAADTAAALVATGPLCYVFHQSHPSEPMTRETARGNFSCTVEVLQKFDQSTSNMLTDPANFAELLKVELTRALNGPGTVWSARAYGLRVEMGEPTVQHERNVVSQSIKLSAGYAEAL